MDGKPAADNGENSGTVSGTSNCGTPHTPGVLHSVGYPDTAVAEMRYLEDTVAGTGYSDSTAQCEDCHILGTDNSSFSLGVEMKRDLLQQQPGCPLVPGSCSPLAPSSLLAPHGVGVEQLDSSLLNRVTTYVDIHSPFPISGDVESHH